MLTLIARISRWLVAKLGIVVLLLVGIVGGAALWMFLRDRVDFERVRQESLRLATGQRAKLHAALADVAVELEQLAGRMNAEQKRLQQADKVIAGLKEQESTWERLVGDREQQKLNEARLASVTKQRAEIQAEIARLQDAFNHKTWTRDGLKIALGRADAQVREFENQRSTFFHFVERTWNRTIGPPWLRFPVKIWVLIGVGLYLVGPSLGRLALYYVVAPVAASGRAVRFAATLPELPEVSVSRPALEVELQAGERLWVKESLLQACDEGTNRATRYVLDWRIPFTCVATGLIELIALSAPPNTTRRATLSNQRDPHSELAVVIIPAGTSLILRPSFLVGVVLGEGQRLGIRRHWQLFRWHAWVTLQFRYFEFTGPCRLIIAGRRGVRVENLAERAGMELPARRTNQDATIGFTPNLDYRPVRAETFWGYYRGMNPLFDDLFAGRGLFICQQVATEGEAAQSRRFWSGLWQGTMKLFGL